MQLWLIPALPLAGFLINGLFGRRFSEGRRQRRRHRQRAALLRLGAARRSLALGALETALYRALLHLDRRAARFRVGFDFAVDRLTAVMLLVVTGVGSLIHIYSIGYMAHEGGYYRFFAYLNLFMFFMLTLVLAANYLLLFVGWEGVGLCSYLLIGFYFDKKFATDAGNKAFIVNRIGDFGFSLAMFLIFMHVRLARFRHACSARRRASRKASLTAIGLLLLVGACGKSAQIPAVRLAAGRHGRPHAGLRPDPRRHHGDGGRLHDGALVAPSTRTRPRRMDAVAIIGLATAFFAATIGLAQNDIKKVFAYSTVSQLGYMFLGVGCGAFSAGIYHLVTHAFFKALLFLGAGSVIHALSGEQDLRNMGGLRQQDPVDVLDHDVRRRGHRGRAAVLRLLQQGRHPAGGAPPRALDVLGGRGHRRHDRVLRLPRHVPDVLRRVPRRRAPARIAAGR